MEVWRCDSCHHLWVDPAPSRETLDGLYEHHSEDYFAGHAAQEVARAERALAILNETSHQRGELLDIGCGRGSLMRLASSDGWTVTGLEPERSFAREAREVGPVIVGDIDAIPPNQAFDAITIIEVLEHVHDPVSLLRRARAHAKEGAHLVAESPNGGRWTARAMESALRLRGRPWMLRTAPLLPPFHLSEFSTNSMREALERAGWRVGSIDAKRVGREEYGLGAVADAALRVLDRVSGYLGNGHSVTAVATNPQLGRHSGERIALSP